MNGSHRDGNCRSRRRSLLFHTRTRLVPVLTKSAPSSAAMASARFTAISPSTLLCITSSKRYRPSTTSTVVACFRLQPQHWPALLKVRSKKKSEPSRHGASGQWRHFASSGLSAGAAQLRSSLVASYMYVAFIIHYSYSFIHIHSKNRIYESNESIEPNQAARDSKILHIHVHVHVV